MLVVAADASRGCPGKDRLEMADSRTRITLDLELEGMPVVGRLAFEDGGERSFTGYAGLIAALEAIRMGDEQEEGRWPLIPDATSSD